MPARSLSFAALAALALATAACSGGSTQKTSPDAGTTAEDTCGVKDLQDRIGDTLDVQLLQVIENSVPSHRVRVLTPDSVATMEYIPERADVKTDKANVITAITCG